MKQSLDDITLVAGDNELNVAMTPIAVIALTITSVLWNGGGRPVKYNGDMVECTVFVTSEGNYSGNLKIDSPGFICPTRLFTEAEYQAMLQEIRDLIAYYDPISQTAANFWRRRLGYAQQFPKKDGYTIDFRWVAPEAWSGPYSPLMYAGDSMSWYIDIPKGESQLKVAYLIPGAIFCEGDIVSPIVTIKANSYEDSVICEDVFEMKHHYLW